MDHNKQTHDELDDTPPQQANATKMLTDDEMRALLDNPPKGWLILSPRQRRWQWLWTTLSALMLFALGIVATLWMQTHPNLAVIAPLQKVIVDSGPIPSEVQNEFVAVTQAYKAIDKNFYGRLDGKPVDKKALVYGAGEGMARTLNDPFTLYRAPEAAKTDNASITRKTVGVGVLLSIRDGAVNLQNVIRNSPAEKAGLKKGDVLLKVNDSALDNLPSDQSGYDKVSGLLRGDEGSTVRVTLRRPIDNNRTLDLTIARGEFVSPSVDGSLLDNGQVAYITMREVFGENTAAELDQTIKDLQAQAGAGKIKGYVLDLRGNRGGLVSSAEEVLGRFLPVGAVAFIEDHKNVGQTEQKVVNSAKQITLYNEPLVVLTDKDSASASEIVAGALRDTRKTPLIGATTYGKGSEQSIFNLVDGSTMRVTIAHWLTPAKRDIYGKGLEPDVAVQAAQGAAFGDPATDAQLTAALTKLRDVIATPGSVPTLPTPKAAAPVAAFPASTYQAIDVERPPASRWA